MPKLKHCASRKHDMIVFKQLSHQYNTGCDVFAVLRVDKNTECMIQKGKCRAAEAEVLAIVNTRGDHLNRKESKHDSDFFYKVGYKVRPVLGFDTDKDQECRSGIHFYQDVRSLATRQAYTVKVVSELLHRIAKKHAQGPQKKLLEKQHETEAKISKTETARDKANAKRIKLQRELRKAISDEAKAKRQLLALKEKAKKII